MTLYDITGDMLRLLSMAEELDDEQAIKDTMEALEGDFKDKADGYARIIAQLKAEANALDVEAIRLTERRDRLDKNIERIKKNLQASMQATGFVDFKTPLFSFKVAKSPAHVVVDKEDSIPKEFWKEQAPKLDKAGLKAWLKDNTAEFAHLEQDEKLTIK